MGLYNHLVKKHVCDLFNNGLGWIPPVCNFKRHSENIVCPLIGIFFISKRCVCDYLTGLVFIRILIVILLFYDCKNRTCQVFFQRREEALQRWLSILIGQKNLANSLNLVTQLYLMFPIIEHFPVVNIRDSEINSGIVLSEKKNVWGKLSRCRCNHNWRPWTKGRYATWIPTYHCIVRHLFWFAVILKMWTCHLN